MAVKALLTRRRLQRGGFTRTADREAAIQTYIDQTNAEPKPFVWTKSADTILASIVRALPTHFQLRPQALLQQGIELRPDRLQ